MNEHIQILKQYYQRFELFQNLEDDFFSRLQYCTEVNENFSKGDIIDPDPTVVRVLWQGLIMYDMPENVLEAKLKVRKDQFTPRYVPRHSMIISNQFSEPIINLECFCQTQICACDQA